MYVHLKYNTWKVWLNIFLALIDPKCSFSNIFILAVSPPKNLEYISWISSWLQLLLPTTWWPIVFTWLSCLVIKLLNHTQVTYLQRQVRFEVFTNYLLCNKCNFWLPKDLHIVCMPLFRLLSFVNCSLVDLLPFRLLLFRLLQFSRSTAISSTAVLSTPVSFLLLFVY